MTHLEAFKLVFLTEVRLPADFGSALKPHLAAALCGVLLMAVWSLLDGTWGVLQGTWGSADSSQTILQSSELEVSAQITLNPER